MTIDDIYEAALESDTYRLRELLEAGGRDLLNEAIITSPDENGTVSEFTVLFSILAETYENISYEILDLLTGYGANVNIPIVVKQNGGKLTRPLLEFSINIWKDLKLTEYLLKKGADPNTLRVDKDALGHRNATTMLWYGLNFGKGTEMLELLLSYGADPEQCCEIYDEEANVTQYLPPLYYSLVANGNFNQTVCLIRYGASPQCGIDVGSGFMHNTNFKKYLMLTHPNLSQILVKAFETAQTKHAPKNTAVKRQTKEPSVSHTSQGHQLNAGSRVTSMRRCYSKVTAYLFANFAILGLGFCIIGPLVMASKDPEAVGGMLVFGVPCALLAAAIWSSVNRKAKKRGQDGVMLQFVGDSLLAFISLFLMLTIILIPLAKSITSNIEWEERKTVWGGSVTVKKTGDGTYEDATGRQYHEAD